MNRHQRTQMIRNINRRKNLQVIESLRKQGHWVKVLFHEDGLVAGVEVADPFEARYLIPFPGISVLGPIPYRPY